MLRKRVALQFARQCQRIASSQDLFPLQLRLSLAPNEEEPTRDTPRADARTIPNTACLLRETSPLQFSTARERRCITAFRSPCPSKSHRVFLPNRQARKPRFERPKPERI